MRSDPKTYIFNIEENSKKESPKTNIQYFNTKGKKMKKTPIDLTDVTGQIDGEKYYVKVNLKNQLFDPHNSESIDRDKKLTRDNSVPVSKTYGFLKCSVDTFNLYMKYLESLSASRLKLAQHEIDNTETKAKQVSVMDSNLSGVVDLNNGIHRI